MDEGSVQETGCVVQPNLPWLLTSPGGLVDCEDVGLFEKKNENILVTKDGHQKKLQ